MFSRTAILSLSLIGFATAVPLESRQVVPHYPETETSRGFRLIVNVTNPATDLTPSVNGFELTSIHVGAGLGVAGVSETNGRLFWQNGTAEDVHYNYGSILSYTGPDFPWGLAVEAPNATTTPDGAAISINAGGGSEHLRLSQHPEPYSFLGALGYGTYAVCPREIPYYGEVFPVLRYAYATTSGESTVPDDCTAVTLLPECDVLPADLPYGGIATNQRCYEDVSAINWPEYGP
ncbi:hypothetical protein F4778DRAFT_758993 [Xylariomycetidae sp. FL2044]|nr:hypothetical protein F4778DRAFT_758993 [Xylariomycetidae sp. FL2044]